ncbi:MAG TPA: DUF1508 domain-containing protein [Pyrinomonadaceae bacterium]|nr:DUF1508 domain-containing protein [Pyrinomonadaceae bacterium]
MNDQKQMLDTNRATYEEKVRCLRSYVTELTEMAKKHGTDEALIHDDLAKARGDIEFYEGEAQRMAESLSEEGARKSFRVYQDSAGEWRWRLVSGNSRIIAVSGEGYKHRADCLHAVELVKDAKYAPVEDGE